MAIEFVKYGTPKTMLTKRLVASLAAYNLKGDFLSGPPTLERCKWFCQNTLTSLIEMPSSRYKLHNTLEVCWNDTQVYIEMRGVATGDISKVCAFKLIES